MKAIPFLAIAIAVVNLLPLTAWAHCQIPCGIYDDDARFKLLAEHITTIEKSIALIGELSAKSKLDAADQNQLVRWVTNKEQHADAFAEIVTQYFLQQRIKAVDESDADARKAYLAKVALLHRMLVGAMQCKQQADTATTKALSEDLQAFRKAYGS